MSAVEGVTLMLERADRKSYMFACKGNWAE